MSISLKNLAGKKFGEFGESLAIGQTKIIQTLHYVIIIINSQHHLPNFPSLNLLRTEFTKLSSYQTFSYTVYIKHQEDKHTNRHTFTNNNTYTLTSRNTLP